jgi:hypothetical protein
MQTLQGITFDRYTLGRFTPDEARDLIRRMEDLGLTSSGDLARNSGDIAKDPIAIAVCRVMQDFRAVEDIVHSLIGDSDELRIRRYAACALAAYCYRIGLASSVLSAAFDNVDLSQQLQERDRLPLAFSDFDTRDYIIPTNPVLGERILREVAKSDSALMFEVYCAVGAYLAPYVNRQAIRRRTPEARIAQRLFDYDDVVSELIPNQSESLYLSMKRYWDWNSRYWEQFALLKVDKYLKSTDQNRFDLLAQAISHARHAVKIERHSFGLTTLGRILLVQMRHITGGFERPFREAFGYLEEAIRQEGRNNRIAIHPYMALFGGVGGYIDRGGVLSPRELDAINQHTAQADVLFPYDRQLLEVVRDLRAKVVDQKK